MTANSEAKRKKRRITITVVSILLCLFLMSVTVYAAIMPATPILNNITMTATSDVTASIAIGEKFAYTTKENIEANNFTNYKRELTQITSQGYKTVLMKQKIENEKTENTRAQHIIFSRQPYEDEPNNYGYTHMSYKIEIINSDNSDITYNIKVVDALNSLFRFDSQLAVYITTTNTTSENPIFTKAGVSQINITGNIDKSKTQCVYIVIAIREDISILDLAERDSVGFIMEVNCTQRVYTN